MAMFSMPLEEDLNSWSHHYNTTTCDDEAMRLAMRDDDTVNVKILPECCVEVSHF